MKKEISLDEAMKKLKHTEEDAKIAYTSALKRSLTAGKVVVSKAIRDKYYVKASTIKQSIYTKMIRGGNEVGAEIKLVGKRLDLTEFKVRFTKNKGVYATVKKGGGGRLPHAFAVRAIDGVGIFHRASKARLPIERVYSLAVPQMAGNEVVIEAVEQRVREVFADRFLRELDRRYNGL